ncbi:MAG: hypothetical protein D6722_07405 [Bacteroidetes bacterium]|nr:MAG: hypothetical protein D6722_07405 [Bacteroidota bacterium]
MNKSTLGLIGIWLLGVCFLQAQGSHWPEEIEQVEVPTYVLPEGAGYVIIPLDYASPKLRGTQAWAGRQAGEVRQIDLVYTRYPVDFQRWRTDYDWLLDQRLRSLYALDSTLFDQPDIRWRLVLQTGCQSDAEAQTRFHGFVIRYEPAPPAVPEEVVAWADTIPALKPIVRMILHGPLQDSAIYYVLDRHPEWQDKLVVMDWTSSMYPNGAAVLNWYRRHLATASIRHLVFFNDGNRTPHHLKKPGRTGGIYHTSPENLPDVLALMDKVRRAGLGGDPAENDVEALIRASRSLAGDFETLVLIPDRNTSIRDLKLLGHIGLPVRIVLFENERVRQVGLQKVPSGQVDYRIHPHYLTLAALTQGSIHTRSDDIYDLHLVPEGGTFQYHDQLYERMKDGSFRTKRDF